MPNECSIDGCNKAAVSRGLCGSHYRRLQRGRPVEGVINAQSSKEDLEARAVAVANGEVSYNSPKPCGCGGTERYTKDGKCAVCVRTRTTVFRKANPEVISDRNASWYSRNTEKAAADSAAYRILHSEELAAYQAALYIKQREERLASEKLRRINNPLVYRERDQNKHARRKGAEGSHTTEEIQLLFNKQKGRCAYFKICGNRLGDEFHEDHVTPISKGGTNWIRNIQLTCAACNQKKHATDPLVFSRRIGLLL